MDEAKHKSPGLMRNYISFVGMAIAAAALTSFLLLFMIEAMGPGDNPYADLIVFIFIPSILVFGLFVILLGVLIERRRRRKAGADEIPAYPVLDLNDPRRRRTLVVLLCLAFVFLFMSAFGSYRAFEYTESVTFCGEACHEVMKPEFVAYNASPHSKIRCVECHVGSGADAYVKAKFNGMRQLWGVATGHFDRPIKTPVHNMRSANETCQKCHWSEKFHGDKLRVFDSYGYDEQSTLSRTRMLIKVGGGSSDSGPVGGIHWHMNVANEVEFVSTDDRRQVIPWVRMKDKDGKYVEFKINDGTFDQAAISGREKRKMDCIDCHNRPAHIYLSPNDAVDRAISAGRIDISIPFIKAKAVEALSGKYSTNDEAVTTIERQLNEFYRASYPDFVSSRDAAIAAAVAEVKNIYQTYFFPEMKTDWSSHPNNIGHLNAQGCFRCHDGKHVSDTGRVIRNDCSICHTTLDQTIGGKITVPANGQFQHPVNLGDKNTWQCAECHKGDRPFKHPLNLGDISQFSCTECHKTGAPRFEGFVSH